MSMRFWKGIHWRKNKKNAINESAVLKDGAFFVEKIIVNRMLARKIKHIKYIRKTKKYY